MAEKQPRPIGKILAANRSEIAIRVFRAAHELGIRTVAIYSHEDRFALHRFKADEAYAIGKAGEPIRAYLDIDAIVQLAVRYEVQAIHPGYGFLSENPLLARACQRAGIIFVGPRPEVLERLGDKLQARRIAQEADVPVLSGSDRPITTNAKARTLARSLGYPVIIKAAMGGGGRGMRVAASADGLDDALEQARREAGAAFGNPAVFLEKYVPRARHIEVQLLGDQHGNLIHLFERDCSMQRRHQKIVEMAPALNLEPSLRQRILEAALAIGKAVRLDNAGTVEFLVDQDQGEFYFIEVNPRIQVEHTVTEAITGIDIVRSQILAAQGRPLSDPELGLGSQQAIDAHGVAMQCRVTTEDPANNFLPDYGRLSHYRSASGLGIRLDAGTAFTGAVITPFYDSLLVKVTAHGLRFMDAARHMERCLQEFRIRGVKTNIPFLIKLITHPDFLEGKFTTRFIDETPELFQYPQRQDRATKLLTYIGEIIVNGNPVLVKTGTRIEERGSKVEDRRWKIPSEMRQPAPVPQTQGASGVSNDPSTGALTRPAREGARDKLQELGAEKFSKWILDQKRLLITDTTFRDAHQSLLATRMRTYDMLKIAPVYAAQHAGLFSLEMWGGATYDSAMRFLKESPWDRLADLRLQIPNILFQMLLRAANAVGYTNYPDNVVRAFVKESALAGIDLFRIFDALNWVPNLRPAMEAVQQAGKLCEAAICYTGDILDPNRPKYDLKYYVSLAKELEKLGAHILAIKDMAGLCKPYAAKQLVRALKQEIGIPVHFHTHDCAGGQMAAILMASEEKVDIADAAMAPLSGLTSQPNLNSLVEALRFAPRDTGLSYDALQATAEYWEAVRRYYLPFESGQQASSADVYRYEMPGGQYTNLHQQAQALGLESRWPEVCRMYAEVNRMFGDIIKVTPTSKVVGDMALFMVANNLTAEEVVEGKRELAFPESVVEFFEGRLGQPPGGFPKGLQKRVLRGRKPSRGRPGANLPPADFDAARTQLQKEIHGAPSSLPLSPGGRGRGEGAANDQEVLSYLLYPRVFPEFAEHQKTYSDTSVLPTPVFFYGMEPGEEVSVDIEQGKTLIIKFLTVGDPHPDGRRLVFFELNGQPREVLVEDRSLGGPAKARPKAEPGNPLHVAAPMPGLVVSITAAPGEKVAAGQKLCVLEAMKMETTLYAEKPGKIAELLVQPGTQVEAGDLLMRLE